MRAPILFFLILLFAGSGSAGQVGIVDYSEYTLFKRTIEFPIYSKYLYLGYGQTIDLFWPTRQASRIYPGDYFYPPPAFYPEQFLPKDLIAQTTSIEKNIVSDFLNNNIYHNLTDSLVLSSINCFSYDYPTGHHREPYTMLSDGDTVYVVSGWLGKFLSFYRVVPGDKRLTVPELMRELEKITPLSKEIDQKKFRTESDYLNYLLEYVDKGKMFRIRNYLMKATLPPDPPDAPESYHNLIEITKFLNKEAIP
jgi:hypothetical protein